MNKEQVYDEKINPLMAQIIAICQEHNIAVVASFHTPNDDDEDLFCATCIPDENGSFPYYLAELSSVINRSLRGGDGPVMMMTTTDADGVKTMTAILP
jgi:hypothetical protein